MTAGTLIVGTGQTGLQVAVSLRDAGYDAPVTLIGNEPGLPYQRPPLSKAYLLGQIGEDGLSLRSPGFYTARAIRVLSGRHAEAIDRAARALRLQDGEILPYDHLVLATGARNRALGVPGAGLDGVLSLRSMHDAQALRTAMGRSRRAVVAGAGFIGLEFAAVATALGLAVTVVELGARPMGRAVSPEMADHFRGRHEARGVSFLFGAAVSAVRGAGRVEGVDLADGRTLAADLVLAAVGVVPNTGLAEDAGLAVANGIVVDAQLRTSDPAISAAGDCAIAPSPYTHGLVRLESVQNAVDQARIIAGRIASHPAAAPGVPWFWSDQGPDKLQIAGLLAGCTQQLRIGLDAERFSILSFRDGVLACVESVNRPADHMAARKLLQAGDTVSLSRAAQDGFQLAARPRPPPRTPPAMPHAQSADITGAGH